MKLSLEDCGQSREAKETFGIITSLPAAWQPQDARESIEGCRLRNRPWTLDKLTDPAFDFGITDEPPEELARWLEDKESVRAFLLERRLG
jgi:hypothetical protein